MIKRGNNDHIIRLSERRSTSAPSFSRTTLSGRINSSPRITENPLAPKNAPLRPRGKKRISFVGVLSRTAALLIVPVLIFRPLLPLYAADETLLPPVADEASAEPLPPPVEVSAPAENTSTDEPVPPSDAPPETPPSESEVEESLDETSAKDSPTESSTDESQVEEEVVPPTPPDAPEVDDTATSSSEEVPPPLGEVLGAGDDETEGGGVATGTEEVASSTEPTATSTSSHALPTEETEVIDEEVPVEEALPSPEETTTEALPPPPPPTTEEIIARELESRSIAMRQNLKKEIEAEVLKGCLTLDGVGYYCLKEDARMNGSTTNEKAVTSVRAEIIAGEGDKEIIADRAGGILQITHNDVEDAFPSKDAGGESVVWQSSIEGRWQIFFADLSLVAGKEVGMPSGTTTVLQLTHGTESNFNPRVDGGSVVWQGWADGNWEIFLADRLASSSYYAYDKMPQLNTLLGVDQTWHVVRITQNSVHDMFPSIAGGLVTWQSLEGGVWSVYAYNTKTGATTKLSQGNTKSENPRFAVTWDERGENGDVRMVGYDIATGDTIDMTSKAREAAGNQKPYTPKEATPQPEPISLPAPVSASGTSTSMRADGSDGDGGNLGDATTTDTGI